MKIRIVVDTSVLIKWINQTKEENIERSNALLESALDNKIKLLVPELIKYELGNVLVKGKNLLPREAIKSFRTAYALPITFIPDSEELATITFGLAYELGITYYDASFLALAKQLDAILVTDNIKHQKKDHGVNVVALGEYHA